MTGSSTPTGRRPLRYIVLGTATGVALACAAGFWTLLGLLLNSCSLENSDCTPTVGTFALLVLPGMVASYGALLATISALQRRWERFWRWLVVVFGTFAVSWGAWIFSLFFNEGRGGFL